MAKCEFLKRAVVYFGLKIDVEGLHPVDEKVEAIKRVPVPQNVSAFRSFLDMFGHDSMIPRISTKFSDH